MTKIIGYRIGRFAYLTDFSAMPESSIAMLEAGVEVVFLDALRHDPHPTHSTVANSLQMAARIGAAQTYFTHICHDLRTRRPTDRFRRECGCPTTACASRLTWRAELASIRFIGRYPQDFGPTVVSVGNFDGIHCAHQKLIRVDVRGARELNARCRGGDLRSPSVTDSEAARRASADHAACHARWSCWARAGLDAVVVVPFTRDLSLMPPFEFAEEMLFNRLHAIEVHEGFNFRFGHKAEGDVERLCEFGRKLGFAVVTHPPMLWGELVISSSNVRAAVLGGEVEAARHLLGRAFSIDSTPGAGADTAQSTRFRR